MKMIHSATILLVGIFLALCSACADLVGERLCGNYISRPAAHEVVQGGRPFTVTWSPTVGDKLDIRLLRGSLPDTVAIECLASSVPNSGTFTWTPSTALTSDEKGYFVQIIVLGGSGEYQNSAQFGVVQPVYQGYHNPHNASAKAESTTPETPSGHPRNQTSNQTSEPTSQIQKPKSSQSPSPATAHLAGGYHDQRLESWNKTVTSLHQAVTTSTAVWRTITVTHRLHRVNPNHTLHEACCKVTTISEHGIYATRPTTDKTKTLAFTATHNEYNKTTTRSEHEIYAARPMDDKKNPPAFTATHNEYNKTTTRSEHGTDAARPTDKTKTLAFIATHNEYNKTTTSVTSSKYEVVTISVTLEREESYSATPAATEEGSHTIKTTVKAYSKTHPYPSGTGFPSSTSSSWTEKNYTAPAHSAVHYTKATWTATETAAATPTETSSSDSGSEPFNDGGVWYNDNPPGNEERPIHFSSAFKNWMLSRMKKGKFGAAKEIKAAPAAISTSASSVVAASLASTATKGVAIAFVTGLGGVLIGAATLTLIWL